jgi:hypothetical protein
MFIHKRVAVVTMLALLVVAAGALALPGSSLGAATVTPVLITTTIPPFQVGPDETCGGVVGTLSGTDTIAGQTVETDTGFHFTGTDTFVFRIDYVNGWYALHSQSEQLSFNANPLQDVVVITGALLDMGTLYDASGNLIGYERFNNIFHTTIVNGTAVTDFSKGFLTCRFV